MKSQYQRTIICPKCSKTPFITILQSNPVKIKYICKCKSKKMNLENT